MNELCDSLIEKLDFSKKLSKIHHVGFLIPYDLDFDFNISCENFCEIEIIDATVGYVRGKDFLIEFIKPRTEKSILFLKSKSINKISFDHFAYEEKNIDINSLNTIKIMSFYTCLFNKKVTFYLYNNEKIEIINDNI